MDRLLHPQAATSKSGRKRTVSPISEVFCGAGRIIGLLIFFEITHLLRSLRKWVPYLYDSFMVAEVRYFVYSLL
jgi:hypothetical protein